jgi:hypothetical protein
MTIGIIGSRRRDERADRLAVTTVFSKIYEYGDTIVSGGCPKGGDCFAEGIATQCDINIRIHYPDKSQLDVRLPYRVAYAKIAYARNELIARDADVLIAVVAPDRKGGTEHTIKCFLRKWGAKYTEAEAIRTGKLVLV